MEIGINKHQLNFEDNLNRCISISKKNKLIKIPNELD